MRYKIKNKTESTIKYSDVVFAPKEEKILELDEVYQHESFDIEKLEKTEQVEKKIKKTKKRRVKKSK